MASARRMNQVRAEKGRVKNPYAVDTKRLDALRYLSKAFAYALEANSWMVSETMWFVKRLDKEVYDLAKDRVEDARREAVAWFGEDRSQEYAAPSRDHEIWGQVFAWTEIGDQILLKSTERRGA